jgi:hypothetical protein
MKKFILLFMLLVATSVEAQEQKAPVFIEDGFSTSGTMDMYWETKNTDDITKADKGARWHLEKKNGNITFWIDVPPMNLYFLSKTQWRSESTMLVQSETVNGTILYFVEDVNFRHLQILEYEKNKWLVHLCSQKNE